MRLTDIVQMSGLNRPTVHRILKTLQAEEAIEQDVVATVSDQKFPLLRAREDFL